VEEPPAKSPPATASWPEDVAGVCMKGASVVVLGPSAGGAWLGGGGTASLAATDGGEKRSSGLGGARPADGLGMMVEHSKMGSWDAEGHGTHAGDPASPCEVAGLEQLHAGHARQQHGQRGLIWGLGDFGRLLL
jgi:hypothetical protein